MKVKILVVAVVLLCCQYASASAVVANDAEVSQKVIVIPHPYAGPAGPPGPQGLQGPAGAAGPQGPAGPIGAIGATGLQGPAGPSGATGAAGPQGPVGPKGDIGATGLQGPAGATGLQGPAGPTGATGAAGSQGPAGPKGDTGATGPVGPQGPAGVAAGLGANTNLGYLAYGPDCMIGQIILSAGASLGMPCNGQELLVSEYSALYSIIGTKFGGDGTTKFRLPDMRSLAPNNMTYSICAVGMYPLHL